MPCASPGSNGAVVTTKGRTHSVRSSAAEFAKNEDSEEDTEQKRGQTSRRVQQRRRQPNITNWHEWSGRLVN